MRIIRLAVVLIVACLIADMATPLCPGAFRLEPGESIDGLGSRMSAALSPYTNAALVPGHAAVTEWSRSQILRRDDVAPRWLVRRVLPRSALASGHHPDLRSPRSSEDG